MELDQEALTLPDIYELQKKLEESISKSREWEERARKAEERCIKLELYSRVENETRFETPERNDRAALVGTARVKDDDVPVKTRENDLEEQSTGVTVEGQCGLQETDIVTQLMIENRVLDYEKKKAESEFELLKIKHRELECRFEMLLRGEKDTFAGSTSKHQKTMETHENFQDVDGLENLQAEGTPSIQTPNNHSRNVKERNRSMLSGTQPSHGGKVKKQLKYGEDGSSSCKKLAPLTPSVVKPSLFRFIDISDNEDEPNGVDAPDESDEDSSGKNEMSLIIKRTPRKRKALNVVYSDGEDDDNSDKLTDDVEDSSEDELRKQTQKRRRQLVSLSNQQHRKYGPEISINESSEDQEEESTTRSDDDNTYASSIPSCSTESREVSDSDDDVVEEYKSNYDWQFEGEMLAVFGKDVEMCMRAVCALYRQQTLDEKTSKGTIYHNGRGFSKFDASRGTNLAEFLTGGDPEGDLTKKVEELKEFNAEAPDLCVTLAFRYSNQLFRIYKNKEDPFFLPS